MTPMAAPNFSQPNMNYGQQHGNGHSYSQNHDFGYYDDYSQRNRGPGSVMGGPLQQIPSPSFNQQVPGGFGSPGGRNMLPQYPPRGNINPDVNHGFVPPPSGHANSQNSYNNHHAYSQDQTSYPPHPQRPPPSVESAQDFHPHSLSPEHRMPPKNPRRPPPFGQVPPLKSPTLWNALPYATTSPSSPPPAPYATLGSRPSTPMDNLEPSIQLLGREASFPEASGATDSTPATPAERFNFSRPRKPSIRQPVVDTPNKARPALLPTPIEDVQDLPSNNNTPILFQRPRRPSISSNASSSTWAAGMASPTTGEFPDFRNPVTRAKAAAGPPLARPAYLNYGGRTDNPGSAPVMGGHAPWMSGDELRSSFRSQLTASSAPGTANTERSSVLTKDSSTNSFDANADHDDGEPSLEDLMGLYEKGFDDDDEDHPYDNIIDEFGDAEDFPATNSPDTHLYLDSIETTEEVKSDAVDKDDDEANAESISEPNPIASPSADIHFDGASETSEPPAFINENQETVSINIDEDYFLQRTETESTRQADRSMSTLDEHLPEPSPILGHFAASVRMDRLSEPYSPFLGQFADPENPRVARLPEPSSLSISTPIQQDAPIRIEQAFANQRFSDVITSPVESYSAEPFSPPFSNYPEPVAASIHNVDDDDLISNFAAETETDILSPVSLADEEEDKVSELATKNNTKLEREIRQSKMIFTSASFMASVPHLASAINEGKEAEKRDSGKSIDSDPSERAGPPLSYNPLHASPHDSTFSSMHSPTVNSTRQNTPSPTPSSPQQRKGSDALPPRDPSYPESCLPPEMPGPVTPEDPGLRDRYGFKKETQYITLKQYDKWNSGYTQYLARRKKKWQAYLKENSLMTDEPNRFPAPSLKTKKFVRKGIPPEWRGAAWFYYAGGPAILAKHSGLYGKLLDKHAKRVDVEAIERDLHRTFPDNINFKPPAAPHVPGEPQAKFKEPPIIASLRRVLFAFSIYNPHIGYCQSLNFIAGMLLLFVDTEEQCFWLLNVITHIYLPGTHEVSLEGSKVDLGVLMAEIRDTMPAVWDKIGGELEGDPNSRPSTGRSMRRPKARFRRKEAASLSTDRLPPITLCMTAWFMSCFIGTLPIETTLRVWDVFFYEGSKTLFRTALAIFKSGESEVLAVADPMEMFGVVQAMPRRMLDANSLMDACFRRRNGFSHISQGVIEERRQERREKVQLDKDARGNAIPDVMEVDRKTIFGRRKNSARSRLGD